jgi:hypothetical protein
MLILLEGEKKDDENIGKITLPIKLLEEQD